MQKMGSKDDLDSYGQVAPLETYKHDGLCRGDLKLPTLLVGPLILESEFLQFLLIRPAHF